MELTADQTSQLTEQQKQARTGRFGMWLFLAALSVLFIACVVGYLIIRLRVSHNVALGSLRLLPLHRLYVWCAFERCEELRFRADAVGASSTKPAIDSSEYSNLCFNFLGPSYSFSVLAEPGTEETSRSASANKRAAPRTAPRRHLSANRVEM